MADGGGRNSGQTGPIHVGTVWVWMVKRNYTCHMSAFRSCCVSWVLSHWLLRSFTDDEDDEDMEEEDVSTKDRKEFFRCVAASMKPSRLLEKASHTRPQQFGIGSTNQQRRVQLKDLKSEVEKTYDYLWMTIICYHIISYYIIFYHILSYSIIFYHILSYSLIFYHILSYYIILYHILSYYIIFYHILSYYIIFYHILSYYIIFYHIIYIIYITYIYNIYN